MSSDSRCSGRAVPRSRGGGRLALAMVALAFVGATPSGCYMAPQPRPYGARPVAAAPGEPPAPVPPRLYNNFGYFSVGAVAHAKFFGEIKGLDSGSGFTITVPPIVPLAFMCVATVAIIEAYGEGDGSLTAGAASAFDDPAIWRSGVIDPRHHVITDFSLDLSYSSTRHNDTAFGGSLDYDAVILGVRFAGPRRFVPRYYFVAGYGLYYFDYTAPERVDASVGGPYWGGGLELCSGSPFSFAVDYKVHHYFGDDDEGEPVEGGVGQLAILMSLYW